MTGPTIHTHEYARRVTKRYARTFYFASHVLPRDKCAAAYAVYGFCRYADNLTDAHQGDAGRMPGAAARIAELRQELADIYRGGAGAARWPALGEIVRRYGIPQEYLDALLDGVEMDLTPRVYRNFEDLDQYCYRVASVVGLVMTHVFGATSDKALRHAAELGTAMQLTNILRDVGEDFGMGRIYLPRDEMARFGVSEETIAAGSVTESIRRLLQFQITRAREYYHRAEPGIALVPDDGSRITVRLMSTLYSKILDAIERNDYDVFSLRAHVPFRTKCRIALSVVTRPSDRPSVSSSTKDHKAKMVHENMMADEER